jgi:hypothetical protein
MRTNSLITASAALLLAIVAQFYFAAFGAFGDRADTGGFAAHEWVARTALPLLAVLTIIAAAVARVGRRLMTLSAVPAVVIVLQFLLFFAARALGSDTHPGGASLSGSIVLGFHALFGLVALVSTALVLSAAWRSRARAGSTV